MQASQAGVTGHLQRFRLRVHLSVPEPATRRSVPILGGLGLLALVSPQSPPGLRCDCLGLNLQISERQKFT